MDILNTEKLILQKAIQLKHEKEIEEMKHRTRYLSEMILTRPRMDLTSYQCQKEVRKIILKTMEEQLMQQS